MAASSSAPSEALRIVLVGVVNSPHLEPLALALSERGHDVRLAGQRLPNLPPSRLDGRGLPFLELPPPFGRGVFDGARMLRGLVRESGADVLHAHFLSRHTFPATLARAAPLIATAWGSDVLIPKEQRLDRLFDRLTLRSAKVLTADSRALFERLHELGVPERRLRLIRWGVDPAIFHPPAAGERERERLRAELGLGEGPVILSPRAATPLYNVDVIVVAFGRIAERHPSAQLVLKHFGDPPDLSGAAHADRIHTVGALPYERMGDYYRAADLCVSIPSSDSSPRSVWEAMACGCACVVSDLPWVEELIEPERDALVVAPEPEPVAAAIDRLLADAPPRDRLAAGGLALVAEHHDPGREMDRLEAVYREVAGR